MKIPANSDKPAQEIQDQIFRKMPIEKKLAMLDSFQSFARELNSSEIQATEKFMKLVLKNMSEK